MVVAADAAVMVAATAVPDTRLNGSSLVSCETAGVTEISTSHCARLLGSAAAVLLFGMGPLLGQTPVARRKILTPEQVQFQAQAAQWRQRRNTLRDQAQAALDAEVAREKTGDCPDATSTVGEEECLGAEIAKTKENYATFAGAIRAMLASPYPTMPGQQPVTGPTGTPPTASENVVEFDRLEAESKLYREHAVAAAHNQFKGGTEAPVFADEAEQKLLRLHFQEMAFVYGEELSNH